MTRRRFRERVRALPGGDLLVKAVVLVVGAALIALGLVLVVLPGPLTIPPILLGVWVWSTEFHFARRWLRPLHKRAHKAWLAAKDRPWHTGAVTGAGLLAAAGAIYLAVRLDLLGAVT